MNTSTPARSGGYEVAAAVTPLPPRVLIAALTLDGTTMYSAHVAECPDLGPQCSTSNPKPYNHELRNWAYGATIDAQYGVTSWLSVAASVPFRAVTTTVKYTDLAGSSITPDPPDTHHANRTITGLADPIVMAIVGKAFGRVGFAVRAGAMLPFGRTLDEDPFHAGHAGRVHEHVQFGAGTVRPVIGSALGFDFGVVGLDAWQLGILSLAENRIGYKPGQRLVIGARLSSALGTRGRYGLGAEVSHESAETWAGLAMQDGNQGRTDLVALATVRYPIATGASVFGVVRVPLYVNAVGAQLSYPLHVQIGIATAL
jgi:hypothetical protein